MKKTTLMKNYLTKGIKMYLFFKFRKNKPLRLFRNLLFFYYIVRNEWGISNKSISKSFFRLNI